jgi:hypothetical protein
MNKGFETYVEQLESIAQKVLAVPGKDSLDKSLLTALDGGPRSALLENIPLNLRRKSGVFFTNSLLAKKALKGVVGQIDNSTVFMDPACGAGDLLLSCAQLLPIKSDLELTLHTWGKRIMGTDIHPGFVRAAKVRLFLSAFLRTPKNRHKISSYSDKWFPSLKTGSIFKNSTSLSEASMLVMNPPFNQVDSPNGCTWATGKVSSAALFVDYCVTHASPNSRIVAILPDVLRSGSRYENWRKHILKMADIEKVTLGEQFDKSTDIHVFVLQLKIIKPKHKQTKSWNLSGTKSGKAKVGDNFDVHVGSVVPYRDKKIGKHYPYVVAKKLPAWKEVSQIESTRRFAGTVFDPPFVVVRRTSRPEDRYRAIGTIILGNEPVAVENHLLVLQPQNKTVTSCRRLLSNLRKSETSDWLNKRIRCRHLTVSSLRDLPWWSSVNEN